MVNKKSKFAHISLKIKSLLDKFSKYALLTLIILVIVSFYNTLSRTRKVKEQLKTAADKVESLEKKRQDFEKRLEKVASEAYIEQQLRDNLLLSKDGEIVVILPDDDIVRSLAPKLQIEQEILPDPNWKKWLKLFL